MSNRLKLEAAATNRWKGEYKIEKPSKALRDFAERHYAGPSKQDLRGLSGTSLKDLERA